MIAAACPPTCSVPVSVSGVPALRRARMTDNEGWCVADGNGHDIG